MVDAAVGRDCRDRRRVYVWNSHGSRRHMDDYRAWLSGRLPRQKPLRRLIPNKLVIGASSRASSSRFCSATAGRCPNRTEDENLPVLRPVHHVWGHQVPLLRLGYTLWINSTSANSARGGDTAAAPSRSAPNACVSANPARGKADFTAALSHPAPSASISASPTGVPGSAAALSRPAADGSAAESRTDENLSALLRSHRV